MINSSGVAFNPESLRKTFKTCEDDDDFLCFIKDPHKVLKEIIKREYRSLMTRAHVYNYSRDREKVENLLVEVDGKKYEIAKLDLIKEKEREEGEYYWGTYTWDEAVDGCKNYTENGKGVFELPSREVLYAMYEQLHRKDVGGFANGNYWSSSEFDENNAWVHEFYYAYPPHVRHKNMNARVRCVRAL
jgi:hypothetical protein